MHWDRFHRTSPVRPNDPRSSKRTKGPAPPPPPRWSNWLIVVGLLLTSFLLFRPSMSGTSPTELAYSQFVDKIEADQVKTVTIDANGGVTGTLTNGDDFVSQLPVALPNDQLSQTLLDHGVLVTGEGPPSATLLSVILSFLPLLLFVGVFVVIWAGARGASWQAGWVRSAGTAPSSTTPRSRPRASTTSPAMKAPSARSGGRRLPEAPRPLQADRGGGAARRADGRAAGHGQDAAGARGRGRGRRAVLLGDRFELRRAVRRRRRGAGARPVRAGAQARARRSSSSTRSTRSASAAGGAFVSNDEREQTLNQLLAEMDGFDPTIGRRRARGDEPAGDRSTRRCCGPAASTARSRSRCRTCASAPRSSQVHATGKQLGHDVDLDVVARGDARLLGRRPGEPGQRGGDRRGPGRPRRDHGGGLLRGARPHPARPARGDERADARREARGRRARVRARAGRRASPSTPTRWRR